MRCYAMRRDTLPYAPRFDTAVLRGSPLSGMLRDTLSAHAESFEG